MKGVWPEDFTKSIIIALPKKANALECSDHRTLSLIPHASKIMLHILKNRLEAKAENFIGKTQFGFKKGKGTREAIGVIRILCERIIEMGGEAFICFVDFEKAFDRVKWVKLMEILKRIGIDWRDRRIIMNLYIKQTAVVRTDYGESKPAEIGRGVRQGCLLSPLLFSIYAEMMMIDTMQELEAKEQELKTEIMIRVGGIPLGDVKYADDQAMISISEQGLQNTMNSLNKFAKLYDMRINTKKTKIMRVCREGGKKLTIKIDDEEIEQVTSFCYLGSQITEDGRCESEIKARIAMAKVVFNGRRELMTKSFSKELKKKIIKTLVWSKALYGVETWTMKKEEKRRIEAFEMWIWRRIENISWKEKMTNSEVLTRVNEKRELLSTVLRRKGKWLGHIIRGESLVKDVIEGRIPGRKPRGRPRTMILDDIMGELSYEQVKRIAMQRDEWRLFVFNRTCAAEDQ